MKNKYSDQQKEVLVRKFKQSGMSAVKFGQKTWLQLLSTSTQ